MLKTIPWDVWCAAALAVAVVLVPIFELMPAVFIVVYVCLCAHIGVQVVGDEHA